MKKTFRRGLLLATCLLMTLGLLAGPAIAVQAATYPGLFYGTATVDDEPVEAGTEITAWVGTEQVGSAFTGVDNLDANQFALSVDLEEAGLEVSFKIGELDAIETAAFVLYVPQVVSLTAYTEAEVTLVSIAVTPESASILVGETQAFTANGTYSDDNTADITAEAVWTSSDIAVATVDGGLATGVALGTATITATLSGISGSATLSVVEVPVAVELIEGVNIIPYAGATTSLPEALTNIGPEGSGVVQIIWARAAWTEGSWLYYNAAIPWGTLTQLENGRAYIIVVSEDCTWEIPQ